MNRSLRRGVVSTILVLGLAGCSAAETPTKADAEAFGTSYVEHLNEGSVAELRDQLNNPNQPDDAQNRISKFGDREWKTDSVVATELTEGSYAVSLTVSSGGSTQRWRLNLDTVDGKFVAGPES